MKTKLIIFVFLMLVFGLTKPIVLLAEESGSIDQTIISGQMPSAATLSSIGKTSTGASGSVSSMATQSASVLTVRVNGWLGGSFGDDDGPPGGGSGGGNMGDELPVGDVTLPMVLFALVIYFVYRGVTTSKRKNNL
ncbi:MAG: hypothetical protein LBN74_10225 [Prevotella sp.]|jgi:hypothetical protein|nr:hypothetical protein [Prevotella sp.]